MKPYIFGIVMTDIYSYLLYVGLKLPLGLDLLIGSEALLEMLVAGITVVIQEACSFSVLIFVMSSIKFDNEKRFG